MTSIITFWEFDNLFYCPLHEFLDRCSRVILQETNSDVITTYINANHISSQDKKKSYIAAQGES